MPTSTSMFRLLNSPTSGRWQRAGIAVVASTVLIALAACGSSDPMAGHDMAQHSAAPSASGSPVASTAREYNSDDVMFVEMMIPHHQQAIEMSDLILAKAGIDPEVKTLAEQIKAAQQPEIDTMNQWMKTWDTSILDHGTMEHGDDDGGMMTPEEMRALKAMGTAEGQKTFLAGMIAHHKGAIAMAEVEIDKGMNTEAIVLANSIVQGQQSEITTMEAILKRL